MLRLNCKHFIERLFCPANFRQMRYFQPREQVPRKISFPLSSYSQCQTHIYHRHIHKDPALCLFLEIVFVYLGQLQELLSLIITKRGKPITGIFMVYVGWWPVAHFVHTTESLLTFRGQSSDKNRLSLSFFLI